MPLSRLWLRQLSGLVHTGICAPDMSEQEPCLSLQPRVALHIPWCGRVLKWQLLLPYSPGQAPDFIFDDPSYDPLDPQGKVPAQLREQIRAAIVDWQGRSGQELARLVRLLLQGYQQVQYARMLASPDTRLQFELATLPVASDMQLSFLHDSSGSKACFALPLDGLDLTQLHALVRMLAHGRLCSSSSRSGSAANFATMMASMGTSSSYASQASGALHTASNTPTQLPAQAAHTGHAAAALAKQHSKPIPDLLDFSQDLDLPDRVSVAAAEERPNGQYQRDPIDDLLGLSLGPGADAGVHGQADVLLMQQGKQHDSAPGSDKQQQQQVQQQEPQQGSAPSGGADGVPGHALLCAAFTLRPGSTEGSEPALRVQLPQSLLKELSGPAPAAAPGTAAESCIGISGTGQIVTDRTVTDRTRASASMGSVWTHALVDQAAIQASALGALLPAFVLPPWTAHMCLAEYVPLANERLSVQLEAHCQGLITKHQLLSLLSESLGQPLELHLAIGTALWPISVDGAMVLVTLDLGHAFPRDTPTITLTSTRRPGPEATASYRDWPYSPRWSAAEMAARIANWLREELPAFMRSR